MKADYACGLLGCLHCGECGKWHGQHYDDCAKIKTQGAIGCDCQNRTSDDR